MPDPARFLGEKPSWSEWLLSLGVGRWEAAHGLVQEQEGWTRLPSTPGFPSIFLGYQLCAAGEAVDCFFSAQTACKASFNGKEGRVPHLFPKIGTLALVISHSKCNLAREEKWKFYPILWAPERWGMMATVLRTGAVSALERYLLGKVTQHGSV